MNPLHWPGLGTLSVTAQHALFHADQTLLATSSCVWNGGSAMVNGWLNLRVPKNAPEQTDAILESPAASLQQYAQRQGVQEPLAGMMTAASMASLRYHLIQNQHTKLVCIATAGIENARRAGDPCDEDFSHCHLTQAGTINIVLVSNAVFSPAACIEALLVATEAKTAACYDLGLKSPVSGRMATGTGTDAMCLLSAQPSGREGTAGDVLEYCGKHTRMGEWIGRAAYAAVYESVQACLALPKQA